MLHCVLFKLQLNQLQVDTLSPRKSDGFMRAAACGKLKMQCSYVARTITKFPLSGGAYKHRFDCTFQGYA